MSRTGDADRNGISDSLYPISNYTLETGMIFLFRRDL